MGLDLRAIFGLKKEVSERDLRTRVVFAHQRSDEKEILQAIEILKKNDSLTVDCQQTVSLLTVEENRREENRIEKNTTFPAETLASETSSSATSEHANLFLIYLKKSQDRLKNPLPRSRVFKQGDDQNGNLVRG
jgi:hypothetical protein